MLHVYRFLKNMSVTANIVAMGYIDRERSERNYFLKEWVNAQGIKDGMASRFYRAPTGAIYELEFTHYKIREKNPNFPEHGPAHGKPLFIDMFLEGHLLTDHTSILGWQWFWSLDKTSPHSVIEYTGGAPKRTEDEQARICRLRDHRLSLIQELLQSQEIRPLRRGLHDFVNRVRNAKLNLEF